MRDKWTVLVIACGLMSMVLVMYSIKDVANAKAEHTRLKTQRAGLATQLQQYQQLQAQQADTLFGTQPRSDFEKRIEETVRQASLRPVPRYSVTVQADQEHRDSRGQPTGLRAQRASVQIGGLTPMQIGEFLVLWAQQQSLWSPEKINLVHDRRSTENRYTLSLDCVAVYHGQGSEN